MSLALINKKFDILNEKERKLQNYYDPVNIHQKQHPNIEDIRDDYKDDFKNYGFNRFQVKDFQHDEEEINKHVPTKESKELYQQASIKKRANQNIRPWSTNKNTYHNNTGLKNSQSHKQISINLKTRPLTSMTIKTPKNNYKIDKQNNNANFDTYSNQNQIKSGNILFGASSPEQNITKQQRNISSAYQTQQNYYFQQNQQQGVQQRPMTAQVGNFTYQTRDKGEKYWLNTKKFDKQNKNKQVRNFSALNKIVVDVNQNQYQMAGDINPIHQHVLSQRFNDQKIYIDETGRAHNFAREQDLFQPRKRSPSNKEKKEIYQSFKEARDQLSDKFNQIQLREGLKSPEQPKISYQTYQSNIAKLINEQEDQKKKSKLSYSELEQLSQSDQKQKQEQLQQKQKQKLKAKPQSAIVKKKQQTLTNQSQSSQNSNQEKKKSRPATAQAGLLTNLDYTAKFSNQFIKNQKKNQGGNQKDEYISEEEQEDDDDDDFDEKLNNHKIYKKIDDEKNGKNKNNASSLKNSQKLGKKMKNENKIEMSQEETANKEYMVIKNKKQIIQKMKEIKSMVMSLQQGEQQIFVQDKNQTIPPFDEIKWENLQRDQTSNFSMVVIDLKTMNFISMQQVSIENSQLVNVQLPKASRVIDFKRIFDALFLESDHTDDSLQSKPLFYLMLYQDNQQGFQICLFEKLIFQNYSSQPLDQSLVNLLMNFYLRFIMVFDPNTDLMLDDILQNSLFIIQRKQKVPIQISDVIKKLADKVIFIEDKSKKTKRVNLFIIMLNQLVKKHEQEIIINNHIQIQNSPPKLIQQTKQIYDHENQNNWQQEDVKNKNNDESKQNKKNMIQQLDNSQSEDDEEDKFIMLQQQNNTNKRARPQTAAIKRPQTAKLGNPKNLNFNQNQNQQYQTIKQGNLQNESNNNYQLQQEQDDNIIPEKSYEASNTNIQQSQLNYSNLYQTGEQYQNINQSQNQNQNQDNENDFDYENNFYNMNSINSNYKSQNLNQQMSLRQYSQGSIQRQFSDYLDYQGKDAVINNFAVATNTFGGQRLTPIENYQMIDQRHSQTHYRPKSGKSLSGFFSTKNSNTGHFSGLLNLKQQLQYQQSKRSFVKENPQFKQSSKMLNANQHPYSQQKEFKQKKNNFMAIGVKGNQFQLPENYSNHDQQYQNDYEQQQQNQLYLQEM